MGVKRSNLGRGVAGLLARLPITSQVLGWNLGPESLEDSALSKSDEVKWRDPQ
jgi:hypothetical protein